MRYGMTIPFQDVPLSEHPDCVRELEDLGYTDVWTSEAQDLDGFLPLALASQWTPSLRLGCAVFPVQTRGPALFAMSAATLALAAPGRFVLGIGSSSEYIVRFQNARPFAKPYQATRDMARFLRASCALRSTARRSTRSSRPSRCADSSCDAPAGVSSSALKGLRGQNIRTARE